MNYRDLHLTGEKRRLRSCDNGAADARELIELREIVTQLRNQLSEKDRQLRDRTPSHFRSPEFFFEFLIFYELIRYLADHQSKNGFKFQKVGNINFSFAHRRKIGEQYLRSRFQPAKGVAKEITRFSSRGQKLMSHMKSIGVANNPSLSRAEQYVILGGFQRE